MKGLLDPFKLQINALHGLTDFLENQKFFELFSVSCCFIQGDR